jgi:hypothetical protein
MTLSDLASLGSFVGAVAVMISLIRLALINMQTTFQQRGCSTSGPTKPI